MEKDLPEIISEVGFNYDDDKKEFSKYPNGTNRRIVDLCGGVSEDSSLVITLSLALGRKDDDTMSLTFDAEELLNKILKALVFGEES